MKTQGFKRGFVGISTVIVLTLGFYINLWGVANDDWFDNFAGLTESFIVGRLAKSKQAGIFSEGGLIGREVNLPEGKHPRRYQYEIYYNDIPFQTYRPYRSNPAIQGIIFSVLDRYLSISAQAKVNFFRLIASVISASIMSVFLLWVLDIFGLFSTIMSLFLVVLSPWLTVAGGHLYWIFGTIYLPLLVPLFLLHMEFKGKKLTFRVWFVSISLSVLLKCLITGFELISTTLVMMTMPVIFYSIWQKWKPRLFFQRFLTASCAGIIGVLISATILSFQIAQVSGSVQKGLEHFQQQFLIRTYPNEESIHREIPQEILASTNVPMISVIEPYLGGNVLSFPTRTGHYSLSSGGLLLIFAVVSVLVFIMSRNAPLVALTITTWLSILAPLSWFIIFKSHSVRHPHLNYLAWYMPMLLLMFPNIFYFIQYQTRSKLGFIEAN